MSTSNARKSIHHWIWWLLFVAAFVLPWFVVIGSHNALTAWFPGQFKVDQWRNLSSISFLLGGIAAAILLYRLPKSASLRLCGILVVVTGSLLLAFACQMRSNCGDEPVYIGQRAHTKVTSCG